MPVFHSLTLEVRHAVTDFFSMFSAVSYNVCRRVNAITLGCPKNAKLIYLYVWYEKCVLNPVVTYYDRL